MIRVELSDTSDARKEEVELYLGISVDSGYGGLSLGVQLWYFASALGDFFFSLLFVFLFNRNRLNFLCFFSFPPLLSTVLWNRQAAQNQHLSTEELSYLIIWQLRKENFAELSHLRTVFFR